MVQLNILERYHELLKDPDVDTSCDTTMKKLAKDLLPQGQRSGHCEGTQQWTHKTLMCSPVAEIELSLLELGYTK